MNEKPMNEDFTHLDSSGRVHMVDVTPIADGVRVLAMVRTTAPTGVEMEALTAVSTAALTLYDMVKSVERGVTIGPVRLLEKSGGSSGTWERDHPE